MDLSSLRRTPPLILSSKRRKVSRYLTVDELRLRFASGEIRIYERLTGGRHAVMAVPFDGEHIYMVSEYACGYESYELGLVKGKIDEGETPEMAVCRELEEEIGLGCRKVTPLKHGISVAPEMMTLKMYCFLCEDLFPCRLKGDEPDPICVVKVTPKEALSLLRQDDSPLRDARAMAALTVALGRMNMI